MPLFEPQETKPQTAQYRIHVDEAEAVKKFSHCFALQLAKHFLPVSRQKILVCIGTDRSTGDCLGPLVGSKLAELKPGRLEVRGTLDEPVHASNLQECLNSLQQYDNPFIIAIDACLGNIDSVGYLNLGAGPLKPGAGVNKQLPAVGDIHITGIVNVGGFMEYFVLQNTRLSLVMKMAETISNGILQGYNLFTHTLV
ncbi:MAG: spore protease YyaC [Bacillota bacterium]